MSWLEGSRTRSGSQWDWWPKKDKHNETVMIIIYTSLLPINSILSYDFSFL